ncbi:MAG: 23S rRNA (uracil(1939)-C(5))-methyltransferase RlmD [Lachnospiraceae bacterium]|nr:23S rRNA (uracil(1939)-C(5))-methyltransferase RlmD [Lachnospiraceae bacterium]
MKKGQEIQGKVTELKFPNIGIVLTEEDEKVVVKNSLPGQKVRARVNKIRHGKAEAALLEVIEKSEIETGEGCPHFGLCGGCSYISLPYEKESEIKNSQIHALLEPVLANQESEYDWEDICKSPVTFGYRNKMEFTFGDEFMGGPLALGMHKRGSFYDIVNVSECKIVDADYRSILNITRDYFGAKGLPFYHRLRHEGYLRHLLVRKAAKTGEIMVAIVTTTQIDFDMSEYVSLLKGLKLDGEIVSILHTFNDSQADTVRSDKTDILYGRDYINEEVLGLKFKITEFSFFQTNTYGCEVLYSKAREFVSQAMEEQKKDGGAKDLVLYDLYSGTGTIAQLMAPSAGKVIGVEIVAEAVEAAKVNAAGNGLKNCKFIAGDVLKVIDDIEEKPDMIILDPPRDGIHPKAIGKIIDYGVKYILYISCKPTSLARDLEIFIANGYEAKKIACVDQFPWTGHVETVVCLGKNFSKPKEYVQIGIDAEDYYRIKDAQKEQDKK